MTWAKYGSEYSDEIANAGLTDAAYRTHTEAIGWLYRIEDLKLRIPKHLLRRFAGSADYDTAVKELADVRASAARARIDATAGPASAAAHRQTVLYLAAVYHRGMGSSPDRWYGGPW
jgi:hypothetical protein